MTLNAYECQSIKSKIFLKKTLFPVFNFRQIIRFKICLMR